MTSEIAFLSPYSPRPPPPRFRICTVYNPTPSPRPCSSRSSAFRSFGVLCVWSVLVPTDTHMLVFSLRMDLVLVLFLHNKPTNLCYRHPVICILFIYRFNSYNKQHFQILIVCDMVCERFNFFKFYIFVFHITDTFYLPPLLPLVLSVIIKRHLLLRTSPQKSDGPAR
jgi:hypothetical protein